jgi:hypothetical protein
MFVLPNPDYESLPKYQEHLAKVDDHVRRRAMAKFLKAFTKSYLKHLGAPRLQYDVRIGEGDELLRTLQEDGCVLTRIGAERKARLVDLAAPIAREIHEALDRLERPRFIDSQRRLDRATHAPIFDAVEDILEADKIIAVGSAYAGKPVALRNLAVQVNTERATVLTYRKLDVEGRPKHQKTRYMHIDSSAWPPLKVLIYLNRVTPDRGPFRYVVGSHRMATDFELIVRKTNDKRSINKELFMALPPPFRMYTEFGDAMDADSEQAVALLAKERAYCDGKSDLVLFDFNGVHRGGFVRKGCRYILQATFCAQDGEDDEDEDASA